MKIDKLEVYLMIFFFALLLVDPLLLGSITGGGIAPPYVPNLSK